MKNPNFSEVFWTILDDICNTLQLSRSRFFEHFADELNYDVSTIYRWSRKGTPIKFFSADKYDCFLKVVDGVVYQTIRDSHPDCATQRRYIDYWASQKNKYLSRLFAIKVESIGQKLELLAKKQDEMLQKLKKILRDYEARFGTIL